MIGILPKFYKDELLYSFLSRYEVLSGYGTIFRGAAEDVYQSPWNKPNLLLINSLTEDFLEKVKFQATLSEIILNHTQFVWFARFASYERRQQSYQAALEMNIWALNKRLPIAISSSRIRGERYMKYCPKCVQEDRQKKGETYFRTYHQIAELKVCPIHKCYLQSTTISLGGRAKPAFLSAELEVPDKCRAISCKNTLEIALSEYIYEVAQAPFDIERKGEIKKCFIDSLHGTKYIRNSTCRNVTILTDDFNTFYKPLGIRRRVWDIQKTIAGQIPNAYEVSLFAFFLGISSEDLCNYGVVKG